MKKLFALILCLTLVLCMFAGCGKEEDKQTETDAPENDKLKICVVINDLDESQTLNMELREKYVKENYADEVELIQMGASGSLENQIAIVESLAAEGADCIIVVPIDADGSAACVDICHDSNIPCVSLFDTINHDELDLSIQLSMYDLGWGQGETVKMVLENNPDLVLKTGLILGSLGMAQVEETKQGLMDCLADEIAAGRVEFIAEGTGEWSTNEAMSLAEDWLQTYPEMNCMIAQSDEMIFGAVQAIQAGNYTLGENMFAFGKDGSENGLKMVQEGTLAGTLYLYSDNMASQAMEQVIQWLKGSIDTDTAAALDSDSWISPITKYNYEEALSKFDK